VVWFGGETRRLVLPEEEVIWLMSRGGDGWRMIRRNCLANRSRLKTGLARVDGGMNRTKAGAAAFANPRSVIRTCQKTRPQLRDLRPAPDRPRRTVPAASFPVSRQYVVNQPPAESRPAHPQRSTLADRSGCDRGLPIRDNLRTRQAKRRVKNRSGACVRNNNRDGTNNALLPRGGVLLNSQPGEHLLSGWNQAELAGCQ
jgi:hypothetical protein